MRKFYVYVIIPSFVPHSVVLRVHQLTILYKVAGRVLRVDAVDSAYHSSHQQVGAVDNMWQIAGQQRKQKTLVASR